MVYLNKKGVNLIELLITLVITAFLLMGATGMIASLFQQDASFTNDIEAKQSKMISLERISTKIREASTVYNKGTSIAIPAEGSSVSVTTGTESLAVFIPKFDSSGNIIQPSSSSTSFTGIAFSIIPEADWNGGDSGNYVLIETNCDFTLTTASNDPLKVISTYPSDWSGGNSYLISKDFVPASLSTMETDAFNVQDNIVTYAFVPTPKAIYFASDEGVENIQDEAYLTTVNFRNFRRK